VFDGHLTFLIMGRYRLLAGAPVRAQYTFAICGQPADFGGRRTVRKADGLPSPYHRQATGLSDAAIGIACAPK
jgi:hypothetical protein